GAIGLQIFLLAAVGVIDAAVQHQLAGPALQLSKGNLREQRDRIVVELPPAHRVQVAEEADGIVVPTPPEIASQRPESLLSGRDGRHDEHALQNASVDERNAEERLEPILAGFAKIFEARMVFDLLYGDGPDLFGHQAGETLVERQTQRADALEEESDCGGEHEV